MKAKHWSELFLGAGLVLLSISHWFSIGINVLELLGAFAHFTLLLSIVIAVVSLVFRLRILLIAGIVSTAINGALIIPHFLPADYSGETELTVGQFNLWHHNPTPELAINSIAESTPDIFTIQEFNEEWSTIADSVFEDSHPYVVAAPMEDCCYGIGLFSKYPLVSYNVLEIGRTPFIIAQISIRSRTITVVSLHTRPPAFPNETEERNLQLQGVASIVAAETTDCIVLGDFNVVPWDQEFKAVLEPGKLRAARNGFQATYPMDLGFPLIPIDYITYSEGLTPTTCETVKLAGSDHKGLVAGFTFAD